MGGQKGDDSVRFLLVLRPSGTQEAGLVHRSQFEELVQPVYLSTDFACGYFGNHLTELHQYCADRSQTSRTSESTGMS
jgi:hypothetical protein